MINDKVALASNTLLEISRFSFEVVSFAALVWDVTLWGRCVTSQKTAAKETKFDEDFV